MGSLGLAISVLPGVGAAIRSLGRLGKLAVHVGSLARRGSEPAPPHRLRPSNRPGRNASTNRVFRHTAVGPVASQLVHPARPGRPKLARGCPYSPPVSTKRLSANCRSGGRVRRPGTGRDSCCNFRQQFRGLVHFPIAKAELGLQPLSHGRGLGPIQPAAGELHLARLVGGERQLLRRLHIPDLGRFDCVQPEDGRRPEFVPRGVGGGMIDTFADAFDQTSMPVSLTGPSTSMTGSRYPPEMT